MIAYTIITIASLVGALVCCLSIFICDQIEMARFNAKYDYRDWTLLGIVFAGAFSIAWLGQVMPCEVWKYMRPIQPVHVVELGRVDRLEWNMDMRLGYSNTVQFRRIPEEDWYSFAERIPDSPRLYVLTAQKAAMKKRPLEKDYIVTYRTNSKGENWLLSFYPE